MAANQYITSDAFDWLCEDLDLRYDDRKKKDLLDRATGDLESDLVKKFYVPLKAANGGAYSTTAQFARNKILNAMKEKIREIVGNDKNRNAMAAIDSTEKFINVHREAYKQQIKEILDPMVVYGFQTLAQAQGNAQGPSPAIGLSRADNRTRHEWPDDDEGGRGSY